MDVLKRMADGQAAYDNHVMALMGESAAKLFAKFVNDNQDSAS